MKKSVGSARAVVVGVCARVGALPEKVRKPARTPARTQARDIVTISS